MLYELYLCCTNCTFAVRTVPVLYELYLCCALQWRDGRFVSVFANESLVESTGANSRTRCVGLCKWLVKLDKQRTNNVILWYFRLTIVAGGTQQCVLCVYVYCWVTCHCQQCKNTECCTKMFVFRIYVAVDHNTYLGSSCKIPDVFVRI